MNKLYTLQDTRTNYTFQLYAPDATTAIADAKEYRGFYKCVVIGVSD